MGACGSPSLAVRLRRAPAAWCVSRGDCSIDTRGVHLWRVGVDAEGAYALRWLSAAGHSETRHARIVQEMVIGGAASGSSRARYGAADCAVVVWYTLCIVEPPSWETWGSDPGPPHGL